MYCDVCRDALAGIWDSTRTPRVATMEDFKANIGDITVPKPRGRNVDEWSSAFVYGLHGGGLARDCEICAGIAECSVRRFQAAYFKILEFSHVFYLVFTTDYRHDQTLNNPLVTVVVLDHNGGIKRHQLISARESELWEQTPHFLDKSATGWLRVENWMKTCLGSHTRCELKTTEPSDHSYRPSRLLELRRDTWRLIASQDGPVALEYVALSYCWGTGSIDGVLMLLISTRDQMGMEQPISVLPQTFKDAIQVAMHFGISYLWIDRLCIVQDSKDDWAFESLRMMDVYQNARFCIAALDAANAETGLFTSKDPNRHLAVDLDFQPTEDGDFMPYVDRWLSNYAFIDMQLAPLWRRAWVVQERLLARRTVYFGTKQIYWECHEMHCCEKVPLGLDHIPDSWPRIDWAMYDKVRDLLPGASFPWKPLIAASGGKGHNTTAYDQIFIEWNSIVQEYSTKILTFSSDKLVAISGAAKAVKSVLQQIDPHRPHRYFAGHWEENLLPSITWVSESQALKHDLRPGLEQCSAPSWSWASLKRAKINTLFLKPHSQICASVTRIEADSVTADDADASLSAKLTLNGPHSTISFQNSEGRCEVPADYLWLEDFQVAIRNGSGEVVKTGQIRGKGSNISINMDVRDEGEAPSDLIWIAISPVGHGKTRHVIRGLMLAAIRESDGFRRLGVITHTRDTKQSCLDFVKRLDKRTLSIV